MKTGYDIIIQAGQSNAQGCGIIERKGGTGIYIPRDEVLYYADDFEKTDLLEKCSNGSKFEVCTAKERGDETYAVTNFSLPFAEEYVKAGLLESGRKLLIIRAAVGGTVFRDGHWGKTEDLYLRLLEAVKHALKLDYGQNDHRLVAFLWHQGEAEVAQETTGERVYNDLKYLVDSVRNTFNCPELPFIAGDFVQDWKNASEEMVRLCKVVVDAMRKVCEDLPRAAFVSSEGLLSNRQDPNSPDIGGVKQDNIHFCHDAQNTLGKRYFEKFIGLIKRS